MLKVQRNIFYLVLFLMTILFSACSSSSDSGESAGESGTDIPVPQSPVAVDDTAITLMDTSVDISVLLNDSDPNDDVFSIASITTPANGNAIINLNGTITYTPGLGITGNDTFDYNISDSDGNQATANVVVNIKSTNTAPVADAGVQQIVHLSDGSVTLDGSGSTDSDGDLLYYLWDVTSVPDGSSITMVENNNSEITNFTPDITGNYIFTLSVSDGLEQDINATEIIVTHNDTPTAIVTKSINVAAFNSPVRLDASNSSDPEGDELTYIWTQLTGTDVTSGVGYLSGVDPIFTTPDSEGLLDFNLTVSDGVDTSEPVTAHISVLEQADDAVFISPSVGSDDASCGAYETPCLTMQFGLDRAIGRVGFVYVQEGSYGESVTLSTGISLLGSYGNYWSKTPAISSTILGTTNHALFGEGVSNIQIEGFSLFGASATSTADNSSYSVMLINSNLINITNNNITSGNGIRGAYAAHGVSGSDGADGNNGQNGAVDDEVTASGGSGGYSIYSSGGRGGNGHYAADGSNGSSGAVSGGLGGAVGTTGEAGGNGMDGPYANNGSHGAGGIAIGTLSSSGLTAAYAENGRDGGFGGGGGGGGAGGGQKGTFVTDGTGNAGGGGGAGGNHGTYGYGAQGGGSSIGIYLFDSTNIEITNNTITAQNGGEGGPGGIGASGGIGGNGGLGATVGEGSEIGIGGNGGAGGDGGAGGHGGGGYGGSSIGILKTTSSTLVESSNTYILGSAGAGGASKGNSGASGLVETVLTP